MCDIDLDYNANFYKRFKASNILSKRVQSYPQLTDQISLEIHGNSSEVNYLESMSLSLTEQTLRLEV